MGSARITAGVFASTCYRDGCSTNIRFLTGDKILRLDQNDKDGIYKEEIEGTVNNAMLGRIAPSIRH